MNIHEWEFDGILWRMGYRVTTEDMKSLGLRNNPNIIRYEMNKWIYPVGKPENGISDEGGIWLARTPELREDIKDTCLRNMIRKQGYSGH